MADVEYPDDPNEDQENERNEPKSNDANVVNRDILMEVMSFRIVGIVAILFGIGVGIYLIYTFVQETQFRPGASADEFTFNQILIGVGVALLFVVPGVICIGISRIIDLLGK